MPWLRIGDTFTTSPHYLRLYELSDVDTLTRKAAIAFLVECASMAAQHMSDYVVRYGTAVRVGEDMAGLLLEVCVRAGLMEEVEVDGERVWKIIDDPEFIHMRTREEVEWERQRKSDNSNPELIVPVRLRDGDACRYCGQVVNWRSRKGRHRGTYDHREPGQAATVDTLVVACQGCNASRDRDPLADQRHPLLPAPRKPYYSPHTRDWIADHDWAKANGYSIDSRRGRTIPPGTIPDDRKQIVDQTSAATTPATDDRAPASQADPTPCATPAAGRDTDATQRATPAPSEDTDATPARPTTPVDTAAPATPAPRRDTATSARPGHQLDTAATHPARPAPADTAAPARTDNQSVIAANRATTALSRDTAHPPRPAPTPDLADRTDPADRQSPTSGNAGSGRDGAGRVGSQVRASAPVPTPGRSSSSSRGRRARRRGRRSHRRNHQ